MKHFYFTFRIQCREKLLSDFVRLLKWMGIISVVVILLNLIGVSVFVLVKEGWNTPIFLRSLLLNIMLEGLIMALVGGLSFLGFEKYRSLLSGGQIAYDRQQENERKHVIKDESKLNLGALLVSTGIFLFFIAFTCFSLLF